MKLGINNSIWEIKGISFEKTIPLIKDFGFNFVDVLALGSANPILLSSKDKLRISGEFQKKGLIASNMVTLPAGNISTSDDAEKEKYLSYVKACADFQTELGGRQILIGRGCGQKTIDLSHEKAWLNSVSFISNICEYLMNLKMFLTLELDPAVYYMVNSTYRMVKMIEDVGAPNLFANIDIGHLAITRESPEKLKKLKNYIMHIHISDNDGNKHENLIIGRGAALVKEYLKELISLDLDKANEAYSEKMVAALELGEMGQEIDDVNFYVKESMDFVLKNVPELSF